MIKNAIKKLKNKETIFRRNKINEKIKNESGRRRKEKKIGPKKNKERQKKEFCKKRDQDHSLVNDRKRMT